MERLKKRREFQAAAKGMRTGRKAFVLQTLERSDAAPPRLGLTVTKRTAAKAVERNRIRRRLREAARIAAAAAKPGHDYVLVGRRGVLDMAFDQLTGDIAAAFGQTTRKDGGRPARSSP